MFISKGRTIGTNLLFVMPSGISLLLILNLGVLGSSVKVLSLSGSVSNESSVLSKIVVSNASVFLLGGSTFL